MPQLTKNEVRRLVTQSEQSAQRAQICQALLAHGFQYLHNEGQWMTFTRKDVQVRQNAEDGWALWMPDTNGKARNSLQHQYNPTHSGRGAEDLIMALGKVGL